jgi:transcriptional regulator with XRE-family HTH domain
MKIVMARKNKLRSIRTAAGLTITELSRRAKVSTKVISQTELSQRNPTLVTKNKILKGLNAANGTEKKMYTLKDLFPDDD